MTMVDPVTSQSIFGSVQWDVGEVAIAEKYRRVLTHVFEKMHALHDDQLKLSFLRDKTGFDIAAGFEELKHTDLSVRINYYRSSAMEYGWSYGEQRRYAILMIGADALRSKNDSLLATTIGHELGHVVEGMLTHKESLDHIATQALEQKNDLDQRNDFHKVSDYQQQGPDMVERNWNSEFFADVFNAALDPDGANIGLNAPNGSLNKLFMNGHIGLVMAQFLGNACELRNRFIMGLQKDPVEANKSTFLNKVLGMDVNPTHPPDISRSAKDATLRKSLKAFEKGRS